LNFQIGYVCRSQKKAALSELHPNGKREKLRNKEI
jgi:hypothetical protein